MSEQFPVEILIPTPPPIDTCQTCRFWASADLNGTDGRCHFNAPNVLIVMGAPTLWPRTAHTDWCGQYSVRPVTVATQPA